MVPRLEKGSELFFNRSTNSSDPFLLRSDPAQKFTCKYDRLNRLIEEAFDENNDGWTSGADYLDDYYVDLSSNRVQKNRNLDSDSAVEQAASHDQHCIAIAIETIFFMNGLPIRFHN